MCSKKQYLGSLGMNPSNPCFHQFLEILIVGFYKYSLLVEFLLQICGCFQTKQKVFSEVILVFFFLIMTSGFFSFNLLICTMLVSQMICKLFHNQVQIFSTINAVVFHRLRLCCFMCNSEKFKNLCLGCSQITYIALQGSTKEPLPQVILGQK